MLALHRTLSVRYLRQRWSRTVLVIASIALGVGTLLATRALNDAMQKATRGAVTPLAGFGELFVTNGDHGVNRDVVADLRAAGIKGIKESQPLVIGRLLLPELDNRAVPLVGVELGSESRTAAAWGIEAKLTHPLALLAGGKPAFVGAELATKLTGSHLRVRAGGQESQLALAGTVDARGPAASLGGNVVFMRLADAAALMGRPGYVTRIDLALEPGANLDQVRQEVDRLLAGRGQVRSPEANDQMVRDVIGGIELGFSLGGVGALIVGLFLVYNALSVSVAERRHDIGILRSLGATRLQVAALFAGEAALLGLVGACLGVPLGMGLAEVSAGPLRKVLSDIFVPLGGISVPLTFANVGSAVAAGIATALLATLVPALQAAREEPADAVRRAPPRAGWRLRLAQAAGSIGLIAAGVGCFLLRQALPERWGTFVSVCLVFVGGLVATPLFVAAAVRLIQPLVYPFFGIEGRLAADNLARSPGRTGLVIAALAAGVALMVETAGLTLSSEEAIVSWLERAFPSELVVTASSPIAASGDSQEMNEELGRLLASVGGVQSVQPVRFRRPYFRDKMIFLIVLDTGPYAAAVRGRTALPSLELYPQLAVPGNVLVSENFAALHGVAVGDRISLSGRTGPVQLHVVGTVLDYSWNRGCLIMDRQFYCREFDDRLVDAFDLFLEPGTDVEAVRQTVLKKYGAEHGLIVMTRSEVRQTVVDIIRRLYGISYAQQVVMMIVAGLGVVMALLISVLQRRRELGLLRAVGASQVQVVRSLLAEAALMGLLGSLMGLLLGIPLQWWAVRIILFEETGFVFSVRIPWTAAGQVVCVALLAAVLAGLAPALHAMRVRITESIAYE